MKVVPINQYIEVDPNLMFRISWNLPTFIIRRNWAVVPLSWMTLNISSNSKKPTLYEATSMKMKMKMKMTPAELGRLLSMTDDQLSFTLTSEMDILSRDILQKKTRDILNSSLSQSTNQVKIEKVYQM